MQKGSIIFLTDLAEYSCEPTLSIREVLRRINASEHLFQVVVDEAGRAIGTVTDGDIRRGVLEGLDLDADIAGCMFTGFKRHIEGEIESLEALLLDPARPVKFIPLLNADGMLTRLAVVSHDAPERRIAHALIMAGGFGTRLGKLTQNTPKPLVEVRGRPILDHVLTALESASVPQVHIAVHHMADQILSYVNARRSSAEFSFIYEDRPLGTAGAVNLVPMSSPDPLLVINADVVTDVDFRALREYHERQGLDATLCVSSHDTQIPYGVVQFDETGSFQRILEKPTISHYVSSGVYLLAPRVVGLVETGETIDMPTLLDRARGHDMRIGVFPIHEYWIDLGRPSDIETFEANV